MDRPPRDTLSVSLLIMRRRCLRDVFVIALKICHTRRFMSLLRLPDGSRERSFARALP